MKKIFITTASLFLLATIFAFTIPVSWKVAPKYNISFSAAGVSGIFKTFTGTIIFDEQNPAASRFNLSIDVNSINTGNGMQNKHAKGADWFDAAKYPTISFASKKITRAGNGYLVTGDLQMHGITRSYNFPFQFKKAGAGAVFTSSFQVNRNDFRIGAPGGEVGEMIKLNITVPVTK